MLAALPFAVAVAAFGVSYGVLARSSGMGKLAPFVMSAITFAGSAQFAVASILGAGGGVNEAIAAAILLNARFAPIGLAVAPALATRLWARVAEAQLVVDESWALANEGGGRFNRHRLLGAGAALYVAWVTGTGVGVAAGDLVGDAGRLGLDAAFPALFLGLVVRQLTTWRAVAAAAAGAAIALSLVPVSRPGVPVIAACAASVVGLVRR